MSTAPPMTSTVSEPVAIQKKQGHDEYWIDADKTEEEFRNYENSPRDATVREFYRNCNSRQTYDFVMKKHAEYLNFNHCEKTVLEMLHYTDQIVDDSDPDTESSQIAHALQAAEACRKEYPELDWLHLTCLIHDLGKVLCVKDEKLGLKGDPQWCVVGDTFPVGCKPRGTVFPEFFKDNPDTKNPKYNTRLGIYKEKCGLDGLTMSWGHDEYMYQIAKRYSTIPEAGLYCIRYHSFYPWHTKNEYHEFMTEKDRETLRWVRLFNNFDLYTKSHAPPKWEDHKEYYTGLIEKYFGKKKLWW